MECNHYGYPGRDNATVMIRGKEVVVDYDVRNLVRFINETTQFKTVASCSGHGRYPMTVVLKHPDGLTFELFSGQILKRKDRPYKEDPDGIPYIPEVILNRG